MNIPTAFISYSWDSDEHKTWVKELADSLLGDGIDVIIDQYDAEPGTRLPHFMEESIRDVDKVLIVCTPSYKNKADKRDGGVGYESHIISGELFSKHNEKKFIPVIREGSFENAMPSYLAGKLAIDLRKGNNKYSDNYDDLVTTIKGVRKKPSVSVNNTSASMSSISENKEPEEPDEPIHIKGIITDEVTVPRNDGTRGSALYAIPFRLSKTPSLLWRQLFIHEWDNPMSFSTMHRPGIASVVGDKIILNGTTIEEVKKYHRDTLVACVKEANRKEKKQLEIEQREAERKRKAEEDHYKLVNEIANEIDF